MKKNHKKRRFFSIRRVIFRLNFCVLVLLFFLPEQAECSVRQCDIFSSAMSFGIDEKINLFDKNISDDGSDTLKDLGQSISDPANSCGLLSPADGSTIKSFPPVPAAMIMVLTGFLCITFVKDRKFWLGCIFLIFWLFGYICSLPANSSLLGQFQNSVRQSAKIKRHPVFGLSGKSNPGGFFRLTRGFIKTQPVLKAINRRILPAGQNESKKEDVSKLFAINTTACNVRIKGYFLSCDSPVCFSAGFAFSNLSRGPPQKPLYRL